MSPPTPRITTMTGTEVRALPARDDAGLGTLRTGRGNLPLESLQLRARITGLVGHTDLEQAFHNPHDEPLEATYVFPLPDRAAVTGMRMTAGDRVVEAVLQERAEARTAYEQAVAAGRRASIAEEERPDVFTMRVGNILPGERVTVALTLAGPLPYEDGEATYRFPLVVAPRYIPGEPLDDGPVGDGYAPDTDAVPDASRITPPVLLPGFPNPVRLGIEVALDQAGLPLEEARASLPVEEVAGGWRVRPGQRADQDFLLRLRYGHLAHAGHALALSPDPSGDEGTFQLTVLPPALPEPAAARDVVLVLDRSGSMRGWKMAAARRAAARIVDTLTAGDRFAVLTFDTVVERPEPAGAGLVAGTDRNRFLAVEHLAGVAARGGTELLAPLHEALALLARPEEGHDRVLVLVTDGQVGNEDQILRETATLLPAAPNRSGATTGVQVHTVGIDQAVNAGFLGRLASAGGGRCELVDSEDRLDEAMDRIHRRIGAPLVTGISVEPDRLAVLPGTVAPARVPDLFPGVPLVLTGRYQGRPAGALTVRGTGADGAAWSVRADASPAGNPALAAVWARAHLRDLEDRYVTLGHPGAAVRRGQGAPDRGAVSELEQRIVATSLRHGVLCRFTAYVAADTRTVTDGTAPHRVVQPVEPPAGWKMPTEAGYAPGGAQEAAGRPAPLTMAMPDAGLTGGRGAWAGRAMHARPATAGPGRGGRAALPGPPPADLFAAEAERLRAAAGAPERGRRVLLADLASRLEALLRVERPDTAGTAAGPSRPMARLRELLGELGGDAALRVPSTELDRLWERMRELLAELAELAGSRTAPRPDPTGRTASRRQGFWKRT